MKKTLLVIVLTIFLVLPFSIAKSQEYAPGEIIIKFKENIYIDPSQMDLVLAQQPILESQQLFPNKNQGVAKEIGLDRIFLLKVDKSTDILSLTSQIKNNPSIEYAEPNYIYETAVMPSDPSFWRQWNLHSDGSLAGSTSDVDIDAPEAWNTQTGSPNIKIAILDTGVHILHEDLQANIWSNPGEIPSNGVDDDGNGKIDDVNGWDFVVDTSAMVGTQAECYTQEDCYTEDNNASDASGHGTQVSGVAVAKINNGKGIAGVCPNCKIIPVRTCYLAISPDFRSYCLESHIINGIVYSTDIGTNVISMSFAGPSQSPLIRNALNYAESNNKILIAAAGNDGDLSAQMYPAAEPNVLAVAATDWNDQRASYSHYGSWIDVAAPGGTSGARSMIYTTQHSVVSLGDYTYGTGTSLATPHVSGLAGLILSRYPGLTKAQTDHIILNSVDIITPDQYIGTGRINANKAMTNWYCSDSTVLKQCSTSKPQFCEFNESFTLVLVDNCRQCGCPSRQRCSAEGTSCDAVGSSPLVMKVTTNAITF